MARVSFTTRDGERVSFTTGKRKSKSKSKRRRGRRLPKPEWVFAKGRSLSRSDYRGTRVGNIYKIGSKHYIATREGLLRPVKKNR